MKSESKSLTNFKLEDVQKIELEILLEFDRICKKHGLSYQLFAGTLLGAIRHKGFIPWDDDIDVCMQRSEYNKLLDIVDQELKADYFFQTVKTDKNYLNLFAKIRKNNTLFMERSVSQLDMHHGVYIDIFPFDNIEPESMSGRFHIWSIQKMDALFKYRLKARHQVNKFGLKKVLGKLKYLIVIYFPIPKSKIEKKVLKYMQKYNHKETMYVADLSNPSKKSLESFVRKRKSLNESIDAKFEGQIFKIPKDYDEILTRAYGDYMKLPIEKERVSHHDIIKIKL